MSLYSNIPWLLCSVALGRKTGLAPKLKLVTGTLTKANGSVFIVLGETKVRFRVENIDCFWPVMIALGLSHDCISTSL